MHYNNRHAHANNHTPPRGVGGTPLMPSGMLMSIPSLTDRSTRGLLNWVRVWGCDTPPIPPINPDT